jgi:hypothetical protein
MTAAVRTTDGTVLIVDVDAEAIVGEGTELPDSLQPNVALPRVVAASAAGATIVALLDRRPPLAISRDAGRTWTEAGGGLPPGFAVAVHDENPDLILFAARNRLYVSENGGVFWRSLAPEFDDIDAVAWL